MSIKTVGSLWLLANRLISYTFEELTRASFFFTSSPSYPFLRKVSSSSCWPQTHYIANDGLKLLLKSIILSICMGCVCMCIYIYEFWVHTCRRTFGFQSTTCGVIPCFPPLWKIRSFLIAFSLCTVCSGPTSFG